MKKSFIYLAIAGAMTAPMVAQADATLFGQIRYDITDVDGKDTNSDITRVRIGVKGEETMDNGLTAGYFIRLHSDSNDSNVGTHKTTVYVSGDFGKVVMGDTGNPNESVEDRTEYGLYSGTFTNMDTGFSGGGIAYESNNINGFKFAVGLGNVDQNGSSEDNSYGAMVSYDNDMFGMTVGIGQSADTSAKAAVYKLDNTGTAVVDTAAKLAKSGDNNYGVSVSAKDVAGFTLGARYSVQKVKAGTDVKGYAIGGSYAIDKLTLSLQHEQKKSGSVKEKMVALDATYKLGGNASVTLAAISFNDDAEKADADSRDAVKLRYKITF